MTNPGAKDTYIERQNNLEDTLTQDPTYKILTSTSPIDDPKSRILRNGLAISSFICLEDFLKNRTGEIIHGIDNTSISFSSFNDKFREAMTLKALKSILNRADNLKKDGLDWIDFIQEESLRVASSKESNFKLSKFSIGWNKSNLSQEDISDCLSIFNIQGGWETIRKVSIKADMTLLDPSSSFRNAAQRRHAAAHNPDSESLLTDLQQFTQDSKILAMSFDALLSNSLYEINKPNHKAISGDFKVTVDLINFRFIKNSGGLWKEFKNLDTKPIKNYITYEEAKANVIKRAKKNKEIILILNERNHIRDWIITYS